MWYWVSGVQCVLSYGGLKQRCKMTFSKDSVQMIDRDSHIY